MIKTNTRQYFELFRQVIKEHDEQKNIGEDNNVNSRILICDGLNTYLRAFSTSPLLNDNGDHMGGVTGFLMSLGSAIKMLSPTRCIIVFDGKNGSVKRRKLFQEYKGNRKPTTRFNRTESFLTIEQERESRVFQAKRLVKYLDCLPVTTISIDNIEADDVIAYISTNIENNYKTFIMSSDKDFIQLIDNRVNVWSPTKKKIYSNSDDVLRDYEIPLENYLLYRIITGDKSDNINGIEGVKIKTLQKTMPILFEKKRHTIDSLLSYCNELDDKKKKLKSTEKILEGRELLERNYKLMNLDGNMMTSNDKLKIISMLNKPINTLRRIEFHKMINEDRLHNGFKSAPTWLIDTFNYLNLFAQKTYDK